MTDEGTADELRELLDPRLPLAGERVLAARRWLDRREGLPRAVLQTLLVRPCVPGEPDAHATLVRNDDDETRGWALFALHEARLNPSSTGVRLAITEHPDVPQEEWRAAPPAPNLLPEPDAVFAALDDVEDAQVALQRAEARRVQTAVRAWREALAEEGEPRSANTPYQRGFFLDLGKKLQVAAPTAKVLVHTADDLERWTPRTWALFTSGRVPWRAMQAVHVQLEGLDATVLPAFDEGASAKVLEVSPTGLPDALRRLRERLQASTADERHDRAAERRRVTVEPAADGMAWLHAYLPAADVLALDHQLTRAAVAAAGAPGEVRGVGRLRADVLIDGLRELLRRDTTGDDLLVEGRRGVAPRVSVLIPAMTALGYAQAPAVLQGYGPIGIRTALRLAAAATSWVRVLTDPIDGAPLALGRTKYRPTEDMRALLRLLDGGGRGPGAPRAPDQTEVDHVRSWSLHDEGGTTDIDNLALLSHEDHDLKTDGFLGYDLMRDRTSLWRTATGTVHVTRPHDRLEPTPVPPELVDPDDCPF